MANYLFFCIRSKVSDSVSCSSSKLSSCSENFVPSFCWFKGLYVRLVTLTATHRTPRGRTPSSFLLWVPVKGNVSLLSLCLLLLLIFSVYYHLSCYYFSSFYSLCLFSSFSSFFYLCIFYVCVRFPLFFLLCFFLFFPLSISSLFSPCILQNFIGTSQHFLLQNNNLDFFFIFCNCREMLITHYFSHLE